MNLIFLTIFICNRIGGLFLWDGNSSLGCVFNRLIQFDSVNLESCNILMLHLQPYQDGWVEEHQDMTLELYETDSKIST